MSLLNMHHWVWNSYLDCHEFQQNLGLIWELPETVARPPVNQKRSNRLSHYIWPTSNKSPFWSRSFRLTIGCYNLAIFDCWSWVKYNEISAFKVRILCLSVWFFVCFYFSDDKSIALTLTLKKICFQMHKNVFTSTFRAGAQAFIRAAA